jgi:hypothetical protein
LNREVFPNTFYLFSLFLFLFSVYRCGEGNLKVFIIGDRNESELVLGYVLDGFYGALSGMLRNQTDRRTILDNLEIVMLLIDELCDGGMILEVDPTELMSRVLMKQIDPDGGGGGNEQNRPIGDLTIGQVLKQAREQLASNLSGRDGN